MTIGIKSISTSSATPGQVTLTTSESPSATAIGDRVFIVNGNNFYGLANMGTPTATGSPTMNAITNAVADGGANLAHVKGWWYVVNTAGAQTINVTETGTHDEEKYLVAYVLSGVDTSANPIDAAANSTGSSASWAAASVSPVNADSFLIVVANSGGGAAGNPFTTPGTYTEDADFSVGASNMGVVAAHKQLSASGATGTITFTAASSQPYGAVTIAIKTASGLSNPIMLENDNGAILLEDGTMLRVE